LLNLFNFGMDYSYWRNISALLKPEITASGLINPGPLQCGVLFFVEFSFSSLFIKPLTIPKIHIFVIFNIHEFLLDKPGFLFHVSTKKN